jgi:para-nitrobenzyl esterase
MSREHLRDAPVVSTLGGKLVGTDRGGATFAYLGIPYAAPPVGDLRWRPPADAQAWSGVHDARRFGPDPVQPAGLRTSRAPAQAEDCLYLNIWTPKERLTGGWPVMVWLCGGGFTTGSGAFAEEDPANLAARGAVVVTVNIRLNVFGFLAHRGLTDESPHGASGNYGLLDLALALRWVRANIDEFGGDSARITFFGESAGATVGLLQMVSPTSHPPYDRAILQSPGSFDSLLPLEQAEQHGAELGKSVEDLRRLSTAEIVLRTMRLAPVSPKLWLARPLRPIVDGWFIKEADPIGGPNLQAVPTIVGTNEDEGAFFVRRTGVETLEDLERMIGEVFGPAAGAGFERYGTHIPSQVPDKVAELYGDRGINFPVARLADRLAAAGAPVYRYVYRYRHGATGRPPTHGDENAVLMDLLPHERPEDADMAAMMARLWLSFATTGRPSDSALPAWPPHERTAAHFLRLDAPSTPGRDWRAEQMAFVGRYHSDS